MEAMQFHLPKSWSNSSEKMPFLTAHPTHPKIPEPVGILLITRLYLLRGHNNPAT